MSLTFGLLQVGVTPEIYFNGEVTEVFAEDVANDADNDEQAPKEGEEGEAAGDDEFGYEGEASCWQIPGLQMGVLSVLEKSRHIAMHAVKRFYLPDLPADDMYDAVVTRDHPVIVRPLQAPDQPGKPGDEEKLKDVMVLCESVLTVASLGIAHGQIDVKACTDHAVLVLSARGAGDVSAIVAEGVFLYILAGMKNMPEKEFSTIFREADDSLQESWDFYNRTRHVIPGNSLMGKIIGVVGFDRVARELMIRLQAFGVAKVFVYIPPELETVGAEEEARDPQEEALPAVSHMERLFLQTKEELPRLRMERVDLGPLMMKADVVSVHCLSTDDGCKKLIDLNMIALMKPTAMLVNAAGGGGVVDEASLYTALVEEAIAYGCIDSFDPEVANSTETFERFAKLENAIVSHGCINGSADLSTEIGKVMWGALDELSRGTVPTQAYIVNPVVLHDERFLMKWQEVLKRLPTSIAGASPVVGVTFPAAAKEGSHASTPRYDMDKTPVRAQGASPAAEPLGDKKVLKVGAARSARSTPRASPGGAM